MLTKLKEILESKLEANARELAKWHKDFLDNPCHALDWSRVAFQNAAEQKCYTQVVHSIDWHVNEGKTEAEFVAWATKTALQKASSIEQSTSPTANLINDYERMTWARVAAFNGHWL